MSSHTYNQRGSRAARPGQARYQGGRGGFQQASHSASVRSQGAASAAAGSGHRRRSTGDEGTGGNPATPTRDAGYDVDDGQGDAAQSGVGPGGERSWQRGSAYSYMPADQQKRQKTLDLARQEQERFDRFKAEQKEQEGSFQSVNQRLGSRPSDRASEMAAARAAQQRQASVAAATHSVRSHEKREQYKREKRRQEEQEIQRHKEKQRLKAEELELRKREKELLCQAETKRHWQDKVVPLSPCSQESGDIATPTRPGVYPSQHMKRRLYQEEKRKAEEAELEQHKASQRAKADLLAARAEEEGRRNQEEVKRSWSDRYAATSSTTPTPPRPEIATTVSRVKPESAPCHYYDAFSGGGGSGDGGADGSGASGQWDSHGTPQTTMSLPSSLKSSMKYRHPDTLQDSPGGSGERNQTLPSHHSLEWPSNRRSQTTSSSSRRSQEDVQRLTECQAQLCSLGLPQLSLTELDAQLKKHNNDMDSLAIVLLEKVDSLQMQEGHATLY